MIDWPNFSRDVAKQIAYSSDLNFRVAYSELSSSGDDLDFNFLHRISAVVFKPDAVARRVIAPALAYLRDAGFRPLAARTFILGPQTSHALWWYQWNRASSDRLRLAEQFGLQSPSLIVLLTGKTDELPLSVRLSALKGPADESKRAQHHLRAKLGMRNRMLSLVHCPDEPADLVRELAITLGRAVLPGLGRRVLDRSARNAMAEVNELMEILYRHHPAHSLDPEEVIRRRSLPLAADSVPNLQLDAIAKMFGPIVTPVDLWDFITVAADRIEHHVAGVKPLLQSMEHEALGRAWRSRAVSADVGCPTTISR